MTLDPVVDAGDLAAQMQAAIHPIGEPTDEELALINQQHAQKPLTKNEVYVFRLEISNDLEDSYHTRIDPETTLPNYVEDFKDGRSIQNSHNTNELPIGRSFDAALEQRGSTNDPTDPLRTSAVLKGYIPRGMKLGAVASDDVIRGLETGVIKDGSVHFDDDARYLCSLCGNDMYERESSCPHLPGLTYGGKRAKALIVDGHALEASLCYDGATPMAMVDKAQRMVAAGKLDPRIVDRLERLYRVRFHGLLHHTSPPQPPKESRMNAVADLTRSFYEAGRAVGRRAKLTADEASQVQVLLDKLAEAHGALQQQLGTLIGVETPGGRAGAAVVQAPKAVIDAIEGAAAALEAAKATLQGLFGMGSEFGLQFGLPDHPASKLDMNPKRPLGDFHGDYGIFTADGTYPAVPTVPAAVVDSERPLSSGGYGLPGRSKKKLLPGNADPDLGRVGSFKA